jgi:Mg-chelatase subunit ChlD
VSVMDENNQVIEDDTALSVKVIEDGVEQNNNLSMTWLADGGNELAVVLAMDYSLSMVGGSRESNMKMAAKEFVNRMKPEDKAAIIKFYYTPQVMVGLTSDKDDLNRAIDEPPTSNMYTNIYDTVYSAVDLLAAETGAVAVILITDGGHSMTQVEGYLPPEEYAQQDGLTWAGHSFDEAVAHAKNEDVPVFTIGYVNLQGQSHDEIIEIAAQTNGSYYSADDADALNSIYSSLFTSLEGCQHKIVYTSDTADDQEHTMSVEAAYNGILGASNNVNLKLCPAPAPIQ